MQTPWRSIRNDDCLGVFIFTIVVGLSNGIDRGNRSNYDFVLQFGTIIITSGEVSIPQNGIVKGQKISLTRTDAEELRNLFSDRLRYIYPRKQFGVICESPNGTAGSVVSDFREGLHNAYLIVVAGRNFTPMELMGQSRICIIHETMAVQLFGSVDGTVGKTLDINKLPYTVIGVYKTIHNIHAWNVFVPFETAMAMHGMEETLSSIDIKLLLDRSVYENKRLKKDIESWLCFKKGISADDASALRLQESIEFISTQEMFLTALHYFTEILGLFALLMGILGVSSIVHLSVKERTKEIAVRLVCGSGKSSIFRLILGESVMIMLIFGFIGMLLGSVSLSVANVFMEKHNVNAKWIFIGDMTVGWQLILSTIILVIICGLIAGFAPACKATSIRINEAMSFE